MKQISIFFDEQVISEQKSVLSKLLSWKIEDLRLRFTFPSITSPALGLFMRTIQEYIQRKGSRLRNQTSRL